MSSEGVESLLGAFVAAAVGYGAAMKIGDQKGANLHQDRAAAAYRELREHGGIGPFLALLTNDDLEVRYMAAVHALDCAPTEGERVLTEITRGSPSPVRMLAQISLSQWRSGLLRF